ncbi:MAG: 50S ribosomal protein L21 [Bacilli bacterium]|jgi:large subunit ribosomal protein L21|nr:50S ribosomal protein L21 [Bacilli bacterium]
MKAIIETGGKQYSVTEGAEIFVEKLEGNEKDKVTFDKVLVLGDVIGHPYVDGAKVTGEIVKQGKQRKIRIFKYRQKTNYHKTQGHRQPYTKVKITSIK